MKGLYLVTDRTLCGGNTLEHVVLRSAQGGVVCVQIREKDMPTLDFIEEARRIKSLLIPYKIPLIINDRVDVALAVRADGVHLGQKDMPYQMARALMGTDSTIGLSVETWEDVKEAEKLDCDYIGVSPVFDTLTKRDTKKAWGLEGLARIRAYSRHNLVAIGGLNITNSADAIKAGADCIAVVSAVCSSSDPYRATKELVNIIKQAKEH